ncbi:ribosome biogenesis/translation initiation ATPase RLI [Candidatus Woesearchaeota archaeon]|nr:ribosome biogenesis/translation initiation ATPase RLI [Candidatus Woesearchaeota archaeon]
MSKIVIVEKEKCNPEGCGGYLCARVSPSNRAGKEAFYEDKDGKIGVNEELVSDIDRIAVNKCPFRALKLINLPEQLTEKPVHRYSKNGFALFRLPVPIFGKVVGIMGRNGIGKSTAVKILAGVLPANLGDTESEEKPEVQALIEHFKGNEAQGYFEKLRDKKITLSYKPQQVEQLAKAYEGTVGDLLKKINEKDEKEFERILKEVQIDHLLDRDIKVLSGGELQRVAIAATVIKNANVLFFDEPTSYLDIKQRMRNANFLQSLADDETAVMIIDHDMIVLDYMSELVHLLYGRENAYGIVSQPKATKAGINVYLDGYLKEENVRFRDNKIHFPKHAVEQRDVMDSKLAEWPAITKTLGSFTLTAEPGVIHKHDVIGILGENGIGKTTFVKELAQMQGETSRGALKVSYKPQYLEETEGYDAEELVGSFLSDAMKYETQLVKPLNLASLYEKKLSELSGGQLQRVIIARCLSADADIFLLDEPSAYLDVEQRLLMSKIIREMMEAKGKACLVVDHDLLFIDYLSEKLIVFEGEPGKTGVAKGPFSMQEGMNKFLDDLGITFRRDEENNRPRANKLASVKDREQKESGKLYYAS